MTVGIHMCNALQSSGSGAQAAMTIVPGAEIEVAVSDSYVSQGALPITTKLPLITGYTLAGNGYTYIQAEFGDGTGNIAFSGYIDSQGNLMQGLLYNDTFSVNAGLQKLGSFQISGTSWITGCN